MESIHIQLPNKGGDVGVLEVLASGASAKPTLSSPGYTSTYAKTLENSEVGDITKLSWVFDQEIRC